ncbi:hypothetical protein Agub_g5411, partial [Astrephomene gubernaculifera]
MGHDFHSATGVAVYCNSPVYWPGDVVEGSVLLNVTDAIAARSVSVEVSGFESFSYEEAAKTKEHADDGAGRDAHRTQVRLVKLDFLKATFLLHQWKGDSPTVQPGQCEFPFRFTLPYGLPGSFRVQEQHACAQDGKGRQHQEPQRPVAPKGVIGGGSSRGIGA